MLFYKGAQKVESELYHFVVCQETVAVFPSYCQGHLNQTFLMKNYEIMKKKEPKKRTCTFNMFVLVGLERIRLHKAQFQQKVAM